MDYTTGQPRRLGNCVSCGWPTWEGCTHFCSTGPAGRIQQTSGNNSPVDPKDERISQLETALRERTESADFLRKMVGVCHLMISRSDLSELQKEEWESTTLPPRLYKFISSLIQAELQQTKDALAYDQQRLKEFIVEKEAMLAAMDNLKVDLQQAREEIERLKTMLEVRTIEVANLEKESDTLRAQVERLSAPVTDDEWNFDNRLLPTPELRTMFDRMRSTFDAILASRLRK